MERHAQPTKMDTVATLEWRGSSKEKLGVEGMSQERSVGERSHPESRGP